MDNPGGGLLFEDFAEPNRLFGSDAFAPSGASPLADFCNLASMIDLC